MSAKKVPNKQKVISPANDGTDLQKETKVTKGTRNEPIRFLIFVYFVVFCLKSSHPSEKKT